MNKSSRNHNGFSLIELMVGLVILSILMGFAIPEVVKQIEASKKETREDNQRKLNKAIQDFFWDQGRYPYSLKELTTFKHPYFEEVPKDAVTGKSDWKVICKTHKIKGQPWMEQGAFPPEGMFFPQSGTEGIYMVKHR
jgi:general secretion pathway protein G